MFFEGQRVRFVDQTGWGKILKIEPQQILVLTNDGLELYFKPNKLVAEAGAKALRISASSPEARAKMMQDKNQQASTKKDIDKNHVPEIDLHIENLIDNWRKMSNHEILQYQLRVFKRLLEKYMQKKVTKLIVIHGKGEGVLRSEIRTELLNYPNIEFLDGSYLTYGTGATELRIRYNY